MTAHCREGFLVGKEGMEGREDIQKRELKKGNGWNQEEEERSFSLCRKEGG